MLVLRFELAGIAHAIDCRDVVEVIPLVEVQGIFGAPAWVRGLFVYRGRPTPVLDLGALIASRGAHDAYATRIVMVRIGSSSRLMGLVADRATDIERVSDADLVDAPIQLEEARWFGRLIKAPSSDKVIFLVDPREVLPPELQRTLFPPDGPAP